MRCIVAAEHLQSFANGRDLEASMVELYRPDYSRFTAAIEQKGIRRRPWQERQVYFWSLWRFKQGQAGEEELLSKAMSEICTLKIRLA